MIRLGSGFVVAGLAAALVVPDDGWGSARLLAMGAAGSSKRCDEGWDRVERGGLVSAVGGGGSKI